jgi:hypothetical protein
VRCGLDGCRDFRDDARAGPPRRRAGAIARVQHASFVSRAMQSEAAVRTDTQLCESVTFSGPVGVNHARKKP